MSYKGYERNWLGPNLKYYPAFGESEINYENAQPG
jgi:hypothetical protein